MNRGIVESYEMDRGQDQRPEVMEHFVGMRMRIIEDRCLGMGWVTAGALGLRFATWIWIYAPLLVKNVSVW